MNEKLNNYLNGVFASYEGLHTVGDLKEELRKDLQERMDDLKKQGYDDETAYTITIDSIGNFEETINTLTAQARGLQRMVMTGSSFKNCDLWEVKFDNSNLTMAKLTSVALGNAGFQNCILEKTDLSSSDLRGAKFKGANLIETIITKVALSSTTFENCTFNGTDFNSSDLSGVGFDNQTKSANLFSLKCLFPYTIT